MRVPGAKVNDCRVARSGNSQYVRATSFCNHYPPHQLISISEEINFRPYTSYCMQSFIPMWKRMRATCGLHICIFLESYVRFKSWRVEPDRGVFPFPAFSSIQFAKRKQNVIIPLPKLKFTKPEFRSADTILRYTFAHLFPFQHFTRTT